MRSILLIAVLIALILITNLVNVYSQVHLTDKVFPSGFNIKNNDAISEISKLLDSNYRKSLELSYQHNEIEYTSQYKEVHCKDTIEIIQIKLKPGHASVIRDNFYFIKNLKKRVMVYYSADTLFSISINSRINYIFLSRYRVTFYTEIYCFDKSFKNPETIFWKNTDLDYSDGILTEEQNLVLGSISVIVIKNELYIKYKIKNERTKKTQSIRKKIKLD